MTKNLFLKVGLPILCAIPATSAIGITCYDALTHNDQLYFSDVAGDGQNATIKYTITGFDDLGIDIEYSYDRDNWTDWNENEEIVLEDGQGIYVRNTVDWLSNPIAHLKFITDGGAIAASGNINSMINYHHLTPYCFTWMFEGCKNLVSAPEMPSWYLAKGCYMNMYFGCTSLTKMPHLPSMALEDYCYYGMFTNCSLLNGIPDLPATKLATSCYESMFEYTGLTQTPYLPASRLADSCYKSMFRGCPIVKMSQLPATKLADSCYSYMFANCDSLVEPIKVLNATRMAPSCYDHMFAYCHELIKTPRLMTKNYEFKCYEKMFAECTKLVVLEDNAEAGELICSFDPGLKMDGIASEMFRQCIIDSWSEPKDNGTPKDNHSYYFAK